MPRFGLIENFDLAHPALPTKLDGFRIAHITDLHIHKHIKPIHRRCIDQLERKKLDFVFITGDFIHRKDDEEAGLAWLEEFSQRIRPRFGSFAVYGNHDNLDLRQRIADWQSKQDNTSTSRLQIIADDVIRFDDIPIDLIGWDLPPHWYDPADPLPIIQKLNDLPSTQSTANDSSGTRRLKLMVAHIPTAIYTASDLNIDFVFAGHTHGGQIRIPSLIRSLFDKDLRFGKPRALYNSSDLPLDQSSGIFRHRQTQLITPRGVGRSPKAPRFLCPPHIPIYTLRQQPIPGENTPHLQTIAQW